jgi:hypothetical protein
VIQATKGLSGIAAGDTVTHAYPGERTTIYLPNVTID